MLEKITQLSDSATSHGYYYDEWRRLLDQYRAHTQTLPKWNYKLKQEAGTSAQLIALTPHQDASIPWASSHNCFLTFPCLCAPQDMKQIGAFPPPGPAESHNLSFPRSWPNISRKYSGNLWGSPPCTHRLPLHLHTWIWPFEWQTQM